MIRNDLKPAERVLLEFGITDPRDIDIEAIAFAKGLRVQYRQLNGCDALIMATGTGGVITVNSQSVPQRRRFSIAHELGHWQFHRNRISMCAAGDIERGNRRAGQLDDERVADRFGSELLMPSYLLGPAVGKISRLTWKLVRRIADLFNTSTPATAIRLVEANVVPSLLVCYRQGRRAWFVRAGDVADAWFPQDLLDHRSSAFNLAFGAGAPRPAAEVSGDLWFDRRGADRFQIVEEALCTSAGDTLCLLNIIDERMLG